MSLVSTVINFFRSRPVSVIIKMAFIRLFNKKIAYANLLKMATEKKTGVEIGGPSSIFQTTGYCPVYPFAERIDCVNFSSNTIWEGAIKEGYHFKYTKDKTGYQWISEAVNLQKINTGTYDFVISSNCLEHIANPLKAVQEWLRVLKPEGILFLILPRRESNFDHKRPVTTFLHLLTDFNQNVSEDDLTHLPDILSLHDLKRDLLAGSFIQFKNRCEHNYENRCMHHHVFDLDLLEQIIEFFKMKMIFKEFSVLNHHILAKKGRQTII